MEFQCYLSHFHRYNYNYFRFRSAISGCSRGRIHLSICFRAPYGRKPQICRGGHFRLSVITEIAQGHSLASWPLSKTLGLPLAFWWYLSSTSTSGFGGHIVISGCRSSSKLLSLSSTWLILPSSQLKRNKFDGIVTIAYYRQPVGTQQRPIKMVLLPTPYHIIAHPTGLLLPPNNMFAAIPPSAKWLWPLLLISSNMKQVTALSEKWSNYDNKIKTNCSLLNVREQSRSSESSPCWQSRFPSHTRLFGMHSPLSHWTQSGKQPHCFSNLHSRTANFITQMS